MAQFLIQYMMDEVGYSDTIGGVTSEAEAVEKFKRKFRKDNPNAVFTLLFDPDTNVKVKPKKKSDLPDDPIPQVEVQIVFVSAT